MVTGIKSSIMEIDTLTKEISVDDEATESKFLSAKTPKHDNKASSKSRKFNDVNNRTLLFHEIHIVTN